MHSFLFFDLDGTLTDPAEGITASIRHALKDAGVEIPDASRLRDCIGPPLQESFADLLKTTDAGAIRRATERYRERFEQKGMFENQVYNGIPETLQRLRDMGYKLCVATSKPQVYAEKILRHFDLFQFFDHVFGPDLDGTRREKSKLLKYALHVTGTSAAASLMIGDRKHDIHGARENEIRALGVLWGFGSRSELEIAGAHTIVEEVAALVDTILGIHPVPLGTPP